MKGKERERRQKAGSFLFKAPGDYGSTAVPLTVHWTDVVMWP